MRGLAIVVGFLSAQLSVAQRAVELWRDYYDGGLVEAMVRARAGVADGGGNFYITGTAQSGGERHLFVLSLDSAGQERWSSLWLHPAAPTLDWLGSALDPNGNLQVGVVVQTWRTLYLALHYSPDGALIRTERLPISLSLTGSSDSYLMRVAPDGARYVTPGALFLAKVNAQGMLEWLFWFPTSYLFTVDDLYVSSDGSVYLSGRASVNIAQQVPEVIKVSASGSQLWRYRENNSVNTTVHLLGEDSAGRIGLRYGLTGVLLSPEGTVLWRRTYTPSEGFSHTGTDGVLYPDGAMAIAGNYSRFQFPSDAIIPFVQRIASNGGLAWRSTDFATWTASSSFDSVLTAGAPDGSLWALTRSGSRSAPGFTMARFDVAGNRLWSQMRSAPANETNLSPMLLLRNANDFVIGVVNQAYQLRWFACQPNGAALNDRTRPVQISSYDRVIRLLPAPERGVYAAIESSGQQRRLRRYSAGGELLWERAMSFEDIGVDAQGNLVALTLDPGGETAFDVRLTRYSSEGQILWTRAYPIAGSESSGKLQIGSDGAIYVAAVSSLSGRANPLLLKVAPDGALLWSVRRSEHHPWGWLLHLARGRDDCFYLTMVDESANLLRMVCYNADGAVQWEATQPAQRLGNYTISVDAAGRLFALSYVSSGGSYTRHLRCYSEQGALLWSESRSTNSTVAALLAPTGDGGVYALTNDLTCYDAAGRVLWEQRVRTAWWTPTALFTDSQARAYVAAIHWYEQAEQTLNSVELRRYTRAGDSATLLRFEGEMRTRHSVVAPVFYESTQEITLGGGAGDVEGVVDAFIARYRITPRGDANADGCVDDADLRAVLLAFGSEGTALPEDLTNDGRVDDADLLTVLFGWGEGC